MAVTTARAVVIPEVTAAVAEETEAPPKTATPLPTPDGRYIVVRGRLWRASNPALDAEERQQFVNSLMQARRAVRDAADNADMLRSARALVDSAKQHLGERGPVWWTDGAPDYNRRLVNNTPYTEWYAAQGK